MMHRISTVLILPFALALLLTSAALAQQPEKDPQVPPVRGLVPDHAALSVANIQREAAWYERVLGFKVFSRFESDPNMIMWHMVIPGYRIDLIQYKGSRRSAPVDPIYLRQGWLHVVFHVDDVAKAVQELQALHVDAIVNKDKGGIPIQILLHDPEGNEIEIRRNLVV